METFFSHQASPHSPLAFPNPLYPANTTLTILEATTLTSAESVASVSVPSICGMSGGAAASLFSVPLCLWTRKSKAGNTAFQVALILPGIKSKDLQGVCGVIPDNLLHN